MIYVWKYALAVWQSWIAFLSGIAGVILLIIQEILDHPLPTWAVRLTMTICVVVAMFTVWLNELFGKEKALAALQDTEAKRKRLLMAASLISQGRDLQRVDLITSDNCAKAVEMQERWRQSVRDFVAQNCNGMEVSPLDLRGLVIRGWDAAKSEVESDIELLESIKAAFAFTPERNP